MHVEYWICDRCKKEIEYDEKKKFTTPEMGYPFIPKNGGGKHFHLACIIKYYQGKKDLTKEQKKELIEDAQRRHEKKLLDGIKKGSLNRENFQKRKASKKDREILINYFYDFYGLRVPTQKLNTTIDALNAGEDFDVIKNVKISYGQLKDMLIYYRDELDSLYKNKIKKNPNISPISRIYYDIVIVVNNLDSYLTRPEVLYNDVVHNQIEGEDRIIDYSKYLTYKAPLKDEIDLDWVEELKELAKEL